MPPPPSLSPPYTYAVILLRIIHPLCIQHWTPTGSICIRVRALYVWAYVYRKMSGI